MTRTGKRKKKKNSPLLLFAAFAAIAIVTIVLLEYIDFQKSGKSFIFSKLIPLEKSEQKIGQFNTKFIRVLSANRIPYDYFPDDEGKYHFKLDIDESRFDGLLTKLKAIIARLEGILDLTEIQGLPGRSVMLYKIRFDRKVTHLLLITRLEPGEKTREQRKKKEEKQKPVKKRPTEPRIAFIIDDMGVYNIGALELKRLNIPITASVLPDSLKAGEVVHWLGEYRLKTMIHLPMQPTNSSGIHYDTTQVITMNSTDDEIRALIRRAKQVVPTAEGLNNHQGSLVTSNRRMMTRVLKIVKEEGLFFVDSRTIGGSTAYEIARKFNIKTAHKDVFLDHVQTYSNSLAQIRKLVDIALQKGKAIAIGHPFESTLRAIRDSKQYIKAKGVKIVFVKELLE